MRHLAILCNSGGLIFIAFLLVEIGPPTDAVEILVLAGIVLTLFLNIAVMTRSPADQGWVGLYFKRKALEERRKIQDLSVSRGD